MARANPKSVRLRRGEARVSDLSAALDRLGIQPGQDFVVLPAADVDEPLDTDQNQLGPFSGGETSRQAALENYPHSGTQRHQVLRAIGRAAQEGHKGLTRDDVSQVLDLPDSGVDARVGELLKGGWIQETEHTRATRHGRQARVLEPTPKAWDKLVMERVYRPGTEVLDYT